MNNAVIYARYSSQGQNEQSIEGQVRIDSEFAENRGFNVVGKYVDKARTGTNDNRPEFQRMLRDAESGAFQYIIVYKFDRFARNRLDSILHKAQLKKQYGIRVISATEPISDDEGGEIYEMFLEWNDEKYSQRLSKRVHEGLDTMVINGTYGGGHLIYGYKLIDTDKKGNKGTIHKVVIDPEQAEIVRFIFTEYAGGTDKKVIADMLNAKGCKINGKPFRFRTFEGWLSNRKYTGEFMLGERLCTNMYPPIIDKQVFNEVQKRLAKNKILAGANSAVEPYLLTGKAKCGHCETAMTADGGTGKSGVRHYYYACNKKKKAQCDKKREGKDGLELVVTKRVHKFFSDPKNVEIAAQDTIRYHEERTGDNGLKSIDAKIAHANNEIEGLTNSFIMAKNDLLRAKIEKKMDEMEIYIRDLTAHKAQIELERGRKFTAKQIIDFVARLVKGDPNDKEYQKTLIDNFVYMVYVYDDSVVVYLNLKFGKDMENISLAETNFAIEGTKGVPSQSALVHHP